VNNYSFIQHPVESLHAIIPEILPGIEKIITVHENPDNSFSGILTQKKNNVYQSRSLELLNMRSVILRFMEEKNPYDWYSRTNLPFDIENKSNNPVIDIFSELQNVVLLIRLPGVIENHGLLVFIYLNENPSNFGVTNSINPLTTDNKSIIAFLIRNALLCFIIQQKKNKGQLILNNKRTRLIIDKAEQQKQEMLRTSEYYGLSLVRLCHQYLVEYSGSTQRKFKFSSGALEKIKEYKGELKDLKTRIWETLAFVESLYIDESGELEITDWHLQFDGPDVKATDKIKTNFTSDKYTKTIHLLDKLESAAMIVKSNQLKLTGTNVGRACPTPITAPAITDALYNHKSKINALVKLHPERWEVIRREFKPVMNIIKDEEPVNPEFHSD